MKKLFFLLIFSILFSCSNNNQLNNCFPNFSFNETINLDNPQFINLKVAGGYSNLTRSGRAIIIIRGNTNYKAFDLTCPEQDCNSLMTFDGFKLICSCSNKEYNSLNGSPINGEGCLALEYFVKTIGNTALQITR